MKSTVDNYEEKHKKTLLTTCREYKSTRREGNGINLRSEKLKDKNSGYATGTRGIAVNARP